MDEEFVLLFRLDVTCFDQVWSKRKGANAWIDICPLVFMSRHQHVAVGSIFLCGE